MMLEIYVYSGFDTAAQLLNGLAAFFSSHDWHTLVTVAALFSIFGAAFLYMQSHSITVLAKWIVIYIVITAGLLGIKKNVIVIDATNPSHFQMVSNVPFGIASPAYLISKPSYAVAQALSDVLHEPDEAAYTKTGILFGAKLVMGSNVVAAATDPKTREGVADFFKQCIVPDILINQKYTEQDFLSTSNILDFLGKQNLSPLRGILWNKTFTTCRDSFPLLRQALTQESNPSGKTFLRLWHSLFGDTVVNPSILQNNIQEVFQNLLKVSGSASDILLQNISINAFRDGISSLAAETNNTAAMMNYSETYALQKQLVGDFAAGRVGTYFIPIMHSVLFMVLLGLFPFVMLLAFQPALFAKQIKMYIMGMIWLGLWPSMFVIVNFLMNAALSHVMTGAVIDQGGLTLSNQNGALYAAEQWAGYASYLIWFVPILAGALFYGLQGALTQASQLFFGAMQSRVEGTAAPMSGGSFDFGNVSARNWNANKHDTNSTDFSGTSMVQNADGSVMKTFRDGSQAVDMSGTISSLPIGIHLASSIAQQASAQKAEHISQMDSISGNINKSISAGTHDLMQLSKTQSQAVSGSEGWGVTNSTSVNQAIHHSQQVAQDYAEKHNISNSEANRVLASASVGVQVPFTKIGGELRISKEGTSTGSHEFNDAKDFSERNGYSQDISTINSATHDKNITWRSEEAQNLAKNLSASLDKTKQFAEQYSENEQAVKNLDHVLSVTQSHSASIDRNANQEFINWLSPQVGGINKAESILHSNPGQAQRYADQFVGIKTQEALHQAQSYGAEIEKTSSRITSDVRGQMNQGSSGIQDQNAAWSGVLMSRANANNLSFNKHILDTSIRDQAQHNLDQNQNAVEQEKTKLVSVGSEIKQQSQDRINKGIVGPEFLHPERSGDNK